MRNACCDESIVHGLFSLPSVFFRGPDSRDKSRPGVKKPWPAMKVDLERLPHTWNCVTEKESLKFKELEHVLIEKVDQLFRDMLWRPTSAARADGEVSRTARPFKPAAAAIGCDA